MKKQLSTQHSLPFAKNRPTSKAAAKGAAKNAATVREQIRSYITKRGDKGATCDEIETKLQLTHQSASARVYDLKAQGLIVASGTTRATRSGRQATVYVTPKQA